MTCTQTIRPRTAHTPGPWDYRPEEDGKPITNGTIAIAYMDAYQPEEDDGGLWEKENEANARLIAAAPELLNALELFLEFNDQWLIATDTQADAEHDRVMHIARAAIAKATAEASARRPA